MTALLARIAELVGVDGVLTGEAVRERPTNWRGQGSCQARAIVRPASTEGVAGVLAACNAAGQTVVVHGGVTGLVGGTDAGESDIVLSLERMTAIEELEVATGSVSVQAGVTLGRLQARAAEDGLFFPVDLGARGSCTIGGNIATNAGGTRVLRYGMMRQQVLGLEAVLADGTVLSSMKSLQKDNAGYDLKPLFIGTEGTLGVVTRAVLRLQPAPRSENTALVAVRSFESLPRLLQLLGSALWGTLSAFEVMWQSFYRTVTVESGRHRAPLSTEFPFYVIIESLGGDEARDREQFEVALKRALDTEIIADAIVAQSSTQRRELWAIREETESILRVFNPLFSFDISLPIPAVQAYVARLEGAIATRWPERGRCVVYGHLGDGNLHVCVTPGREEKDARAWVEDLVYGPLRALGGSISAEHGIGLEKRPYLSFCRSSSEIAVMRSLKRALDPKNLLNPGKVLPLSEDDWRQVSQQGTPMTVAFSKVLAGLDLASPFLGPTELERRRGRPYKARLGANECLFGMSPAARRVMNARGSELTFYSDPTHRLLRGALARQWGLPAEHFVVAGGVEGVMDLFVRAYVEPGDVVVTSRGAFSGFDYFVLGSGGRLVHVPYTPAGRNDLGALLAAAHEHGAKMLYLANPDNPTGTQLPPSDIARLIRDLPQSCLLLLDEAYVEFADADAVLPGTARAPNLVRMRSFSKAYGLAGARVGYAAADPSIVAVLDRIRTHFAVSKLSQEMALAALEDHAFIASVLAQTKEGREHYEALAASLGVKTLPSAANFVAFDFEQPARAKAVAERLEAHDVFVVRPVAPPLDRLVRVTIGPADLREIFADVLREGRAA